MANKPIEVHPLADEEASEAYDYYEQRDVRVAERFKKELERCLAAIEVRPLMFQTHLLRTRRCVMRKFPFLVIFQETSSSWFVIAVAHCKRKPGYWKRRMK
jgi:plasmid stabilization system protein ParE